MRRTRPRRGVRRLLGGASEPAVPVNGSPRLTSDRKSSTRRVASGWKISAASSEVAGDRAIVPRHFEAAQVAIAPAPPAFSDAGDLGIIQRLQVGDEQISDGRGQPDPRPPRVLRIGFPQHPSVVYQLGYVAERRCGGRSGRDARRADGGPAPAKLVGKQGEEDVPSGIEEPTGREQLAATVPSTDDRVHPAPKIHRRRGHRHALRQPVDRDLKTAAEPLRLRDLRVRRCAFPTAHGVAGVDC